MLKTMLAALALTLLPGLAIAGCSGADHGQKTAAMSCADGMTLDLDTNTFVSVITG